MRKIMLVAFWLFSVLLVLSDILGLDAKIHGWVDGLFGSTIRTLMMILLFVGYGLLAAAVICDQVRSNDGRGVRNFVTVDAAESGGVRVSVNAIEQMVKQALRDVIGIADLKISVLNESDVTDVGISICILKGYHVPTMTGNIQEAIRQRVEKDCGVALHAVRVDVLRVIDPEASKRKGSNSCKAVAPSLQLQESAEKAEVGELKMQPTENSPESLETSVAADDVMDGFDCIGVDESISIEEFAGIDTDETGISCERDTVCDDPSAFCESVEESEIEEEYISEQTLSTEEEQDGFSDAQ